MITYMITGGAGFVGTNLCLFLLKRTQKDLRVVCVDKLIHGQQQTQISDQRYTFYETDIKDAKALENILTKHSVDIVVHLAARVSVDDSFSNALQFTMDNVVGTHVLLECCRTYGRLKRFLYFSTDEVYGEASDDDTVGYLETAAINPMNPYAATKLSAESLVRSYGHSFGFPCVITRGNNIYGPYQYPVALIPNFIRQLMKGDKCSIHGEGKARRYFIHVNDICEAVMAVIERGAVNEIYNISSNDEYSVCQIHSNLTEIVRPGDNAEDFRQRVTDRPHNDSRYVINDSKLHHLGWTQKVSFLDGLRSTAEWYKQHTNQQQAELSIVF